MLNHGYSSLLSHEVHKCKLLALHIKQWGVVSLFTEIRARPDVQKTHTTLAEHIISALPLGQLSSTFIAVPLNRRALTSTAC